MLDFAVFALEHTDLAVSCDVVIGLHAQRFQHSGEAFGLIFNLYDAVVLAQCRFVDSDSNGSLNTSAGIYKADFLAYMPHLRFLILSWTEIHDISAIVACQELIYLELDWSQVRDFTPLLELKALEDLNISGSVADVTPVTQMTWLKNLWAAKRGNDAIWTLHQAFPQQDKLDDEGNVLVPKSDTYLYTTANYIRAWRHLPHYYEMRDMLGMHYMDQ